MRLTRDGSAPKRGIVHFGPGAFFRAFTAVYTDDAMAADGGDWGVTAVSLQSTAARDALGPQGGCYTAVELGPEGRKRRVISSVREVLVAPEDPDAVIAALSDPGVEIVTLTITEKGYCHVPASGRLQHDHPDIAHDLKHPDRPRTAVGFVVAGLARRRAAGLLPFTIVSCDNLPANGAVMRGVTLEFARALEPALADWIAAHGAFPSTMVDRITPATDSDDLNALAEEIGQQDTGAVFHEPFRQWVIEDNFVGTRPRWDAGGAQFVADVRAHEEMKLRCLNGTHSALAYLGYLAGYETIAQSVADPAFAKLCARLWADEILPTVPRPQGEDLAAYTGALLQRYRNPAIQHRTWQIAMDGSQKLPQRILGTLRDGHAQSADVSGLCLVVAAWMRYVGGIDEQGAPIDVRDPMAAELRAISDGQESPADKARALLGVERIFGTDIAADAALSARIISAYEDLIAQGSRAAVATYADPPA